MQEWHSDNTCRNNEKRTGLHRPIKTEPKIKEILVFHGLLVNIGCDLHVQQHNALHLLGKLEMTR